MNSSENSMEKASCLRRAPDGTEPAQGGNGKAQAGRLDHPHLVAGRSAFSPVSEEYKKLKARLMRMTKTQPFKNVLIVTSSVGSEGKSITAANLALSLARDYDHSVLLVDADTRKPSLHILLKVAPGAGLTDCVAGECALGSALIRIGNGNLQLLPSGKRTDNPVELFSSERMQKLIAEMKARYPDRYIIIDTPPVLLFAETKMISALADGIIFVIREGRAPLDHILEALDLLKDEYLLGIVYNDAGPEGLNGTYPYHSYYRHYEKK